MRLQTVACATARRVYPARVLFNWFKAEAETHDDLFVEKVRVRRPLQPVDGFVIVGWLLIVAKCLVASWAIRRWSVPIHEFYVWGPSFILGATCTFLHLRRENDE